ncbi:MAG: ribosome recycling factor [Deltaproteobacteria bacterium]|nr:ribosome recycling factor [Deltaproteobacteria bacterium]
MAVSLDQLISQAKEAMGHSLQHLKDDLRKVRTGRANPSLLDNIRVDYYGTPTPLNQMANLSAPEPRLIVISPYDKSALHAIEKAIQASDLGLTPNNDGKLVRIPIPPLTEQRRKELVKHVRKLAEHHKLGVRDARREALAALKQLENDGDLPADDRARSEKKVQSLTDDFVKQVDGQADQKEQEILQV